MTILSRSRWKGTVIQRTVFQRLFLIPPLNNIAISIRSGRMLSELSHHCRKEEYILTVA